MIAKERIERACRIYKNNKDAAEALGIHPNSLSRLCRKYGVSTPRQQKSEESLVVENRRLQKRIQQLIEQYQLPEEC